MRRMARAAEACCETCSCPGMPGGGCCDGLRGFGLAPGEQYGSLDEEIDGFLLASPRPSSTDVANFLKLYDEGAPRNEVAKALVQRGVPSGTVSAALTWLNASQKWDLGVVGGVLALASAAASGFHGYRRNQSIGYGLLWFVLGGIFPVVTPVIAIAQGFGKRKAA